MLKIQKKLPIRDVGGLLYPTHSFTIISNVDDYDDLGPAEYFSGKGISGAVYVLNFLQDSVMMNKTEKALSYIIEKSGDNMINFGYDLTFARFFVSDDCFLWVLAEVGGGDLFYDVVKFLENDGFVSEYDTQQLNLSENEEAYGDVLKNALFQMDQKDT